MTRKLETNILSLVVFFSCLNIGYVNFKFPWIGNLNFYFRIGLTIILVIALFVRRQKVSSFFITFSIYFLYVLCITGLHKVDIKEAMINLTMPYVILLTIENYRDSESLETMLNCWRSLLMILIMIDWGSMIIFPGGLYTTLYDNSWFLGYKTERLVFYLPFLILNALLSEMKKHTIDVNTYIYSVLCVCFLFYSKATGAFASLIIMLLIFTLINISSNSGKIKKTLSFFLDFRIYIMIYAIVLFQMFTIQTSKWMQFIVINILHKDITFDTRAAIWESCFNLLQGKYFTGIGYLNYTQYQIFTHNIYATSAHNMVLTILITSGIVGIGMYLCFFLETAKKKLSSLDMIYITGIICMLVIGLTSSVMIYSTFSMLFFSLLTTNLGGKNVRHKNSFIKK